MHLLTLHWNDERPALQYRPAPHAATIAHWDLVAGAPLALHLGSEKYCIGYYDFVQRQKLPCPQQRRLERRYVQCVHCQRQEITYYTFTGIAADPQAAEAYLVTQPHQAYLNLFGHGLLKVGVASEGRKLRRTLEQGALASLFFAQANGHAIRDLERYISRELGVRDRITTLQKIKRLVQQPTAEQATDLLGRMAEQIGAQLPPELRAYLRSDPEFHFHRAKYHLQLPAGLAAIPYIHQVTPGDTYAGHIRGIVGNLLVLEAVDRGLYVLPMKRLQGWCLTVAPTLADMHVQHAPRIVAFEP